MQTGKITICGKCGSQKCSGQLFKASFRSQEGHLMEHIVCRSQVKEKNGRLIHRVVMGHGVWEDCEAVPVESANA
jgi:hypothetical protein